MKSITLLLIFLGLTLLVTGQTPPRFEDYGVAIYRGTIHRPKWIRRVADNEWRDEVGKLVEPPEINFAGKYFVAVHSCGTACRYYTMTDLSSGRELELLKDFAAAEPPPTTRQGYQYVTDLVTRANSKLLIAQFRVDAPRGEECRERAFILEAAKITPVNQHSSELCEVLVGVLCTKSQVLACEAGESIKPGAASPRIRIELNGEPMKWATAVGP